MKINILYYYTYSHLNTGSPTVLVNLIKGLDKKKFKPYFLTSKKGPLIEQLKKDDVEILEHETNSFSLKSAFKLICSAFKFSKILKSHKIKLLHINEYVWNLDLALGAWLAGIPIISHIHTVNVIENRNFITHITDQFLFVSKNHMKNTRNIKKIEKKSSVLYNAIDYKYYGSGNDIRALLNFSKDDIIVGTISQIAKHKGIDIICQAAKICCAANDKIKFIIVGPVGVGEDDFFQKIKQEISKNNLENKIFFIGPRKDIPDFLASIEMFLLPSRIETFGLVIAEALSAGLPIITSRAGGIPEIISSPEFGCMIGNEDPEEYARAILKEAATSTENSEIKQIRKKHVQTKFSYEIIYKKLEEIYIKLINK